MKETHEKTQAKAPERHLLYEGLGVMILGGVLTFICLSLISSPLYGTGMGIALLLSLSLLITGILLQIGYFLVKFVKKMRA